MTWQNHISQLGELSSNVSLAAHTTLQVGGLASWYFKPHHQDALCQALPNIPSSLSVLPLGRGSNLLISDSGYDGLVVDLGNLNNMVVSSPHLTAEAGCRMSKIAQTSANHGLAGLEFMATVPGDLGGGIAMNAGAFGQQVSDTLKHITIIQRDGVASNLTREKLNMAYRRTTLPQGSIVLSATFELPLGDAENIRQRMRDMRQKRSQSQPLSQPNCGSVFKNPTGDHAARLIEASGLKGYRHGQAQISDVHANFIINLGHATAHDIASLIRHAQQTVYDKFGIHLETEVCMLGDLL